MFGFQADRILTGDCAALRFRHAKFPMKPKYLLQGACCYLAKASGARHSKRPLDCMIAAEGTIWT